MTDDAEDAPKNDGDYQVGYRKPPAHSRFQKGASGNPKGRPPASKNLATLLARAIDAPVVVTENGKRKKKRKLEVAITQLVNKATSADLRAGITLFNMVEKYLPAEQAASSGLEPTNKSVSESDARIMANVQARIASHGRENNE